MLEGRTLNHQSPKFTINGNAQTTTINDITGDFSFSYKPSTIPAGATPYTITYSYAGDASFLSSSDTLTSLTVNLAQALFVAASGSGNIYEYTPGGGQSIFASGLSNPQGLAFDSAGNLFVSVFVADSVSGNIYEYTPDGGQSIFASGLIDPRGLAFDSLGDLFVADSGSGNVYEYPAGGGQIIFASGLSSPSGLAFDSEWDLFEADSGSGIIYEYPAGGGQSIFASGLSSPEGLAFDIAGDLFVADVWSGNIYEYPAAGGQSIFASGLSSPYGLAFSSAGDLFEADGVSGNINEFTPGGVRSTFASGLSDPLSIAFQPPLISGLPASQSIPFGTTAITLSGRVSYSSPTTYPAYGETITVTINGNAQTTTINDIGGDFSFSYNPSAIPANPTPYPIIYSYAGDALLIAANNPSTALTVNQATPLITTLPTASDITYGQALSASTLSGGVASASGTIVAGSFAFTTPSTIPSAGTALPPITFTPYDTNGNYTSASTTVSVTVNQATPSFSNLIASPPTVYGATAITLAGTVSAPGPIYPAQGETITVTINGNAQTTTINDLTGDFSFSYNPSTIPASATPYTITYSYAGDASFNSAH